MILNKLFYVIAAALIFVSGGEHELMGSPDKNIPLDLMYQEQPIPDSILKEFFGYTVIGFGTIYTEIDIPNRLFEQKLFAAIDAGSSDCINDETFKTEVIFEWQYIGKIQQDYHVVRAYYWEIGCMGKFTGLLVLKREADILRITGIIFGGDRHSCMIREDCEIEGCSIIYNQSISTAGIIDLALDLYPELIPIAENSSKGGIYYGEAGGSGCYCRYKVVINPDGSLESENMIDFINYGDEESDGSTSYLNTIKKAALDLLQNDCPASTL